MTSLTEFLCRSATPIIRFQATGFCHVEKDFTIAKFAFGFENSEYFVQILLLESGRAEDSLRKFVRSVANLGRT
jgi:hypothetical protein